MEKTYNFPVFATQGGGLVREIKTDSGFKYIFVEAPPQGMGLGIGDFMPEQWDLIPANQQARDAINDEQFGEDDLFDRAMREYVHRGPKARQIEFVPELSRTDLELDMGIEAGERP
jgi:hypothetical protein